MSNKKNLEPCGLSKILKTFTVITEPLALTPMFNDLTIDHSLRKKGGTYGPHSHLRCNDHRSFPP